MTTKPPISKKFFMMRLDPEVVFEARMAAVKAKVTLRSWIENVITREVMRKK